MTLEIAGLTFDDDNQLPDGFAPTEAIVILIGADAEGNADVQQFATPGLSSAHAVGLLIMTADTLRRIDRQED